MRVSSKFANIFADAVFAATKNQELLSSINHS